MVKNKSLRSINSVGVIVVTFHPDMGALISSVNILLKSASVVIVDNTPEFIDFSELKLLATGSLYTVTVIRLYENTGIANAQNVGINHCIDNNLEYVVFLDQDSQPDSDMVEILLSTFIQFNHAGKKIAAISPWHDRGRGGTHGTGCIKKFQLTSSGTITSIKILSDVGYMDDKLFIDLVEYEWCWRARSKGYKLYECHDAILKHKAGESYVDLWLTGFSIQAPIRNYYQYRNFLLLLRRKHAHQGVMFKIGMKLAVRFLVNILLPLRVYRVRYACIGLYHGFKGRSGPIENIY